MRNFLYLSACFLFGVSASMAYSWFDCDYIHPVERYEMDKHDYERHHEGDWCQPFPDFKTWEQAQRDVEHRFGVEVADAFDWFNVESEGRASARENATWGQD